MTLEPVAELFGDLLLQRLDIGVAKLDHLAGIQIDQVVVMVTLGILVAGTAVAEFQPVYDPRFLEQL